MNRPTLFCPCSWRLADAPRTSAGTRVPNRRPVPSAAAAVARGDLFVSEPAHNGGRGVLHGIQLAEQARGSLMHFEIDQDDTVLALNEAGDLFSTSVTSGDFDGDGWTDLVVGMPGETYQSVNGTGAALVFHGAAPSGAGSPHGFDFGQTALLTQPGLSLDSTAGDAFATALVAADFDGDGRDDLAIGTPGEEIGPTQEAGEVVTVMARTAPLFADGFESGDLSAWAP